MQHWSVHRREDRVAEGAACVPRPGNARQISERTIGAAQLIDGAEAVFATAVTQLALVPFPAALEEQREAAPGREVFLQNNKTFVNGRLQGWPKACAIVCSAPAHQREGEGAWVLRSLDDFWSRSCCRPLNVLRRQIFVYHALIRLALIRASDENHLGFARPVRPPRLCPGARLPLKPYAASLSPRRRRKHAQSALRLRHRRARRAPRRPCARRSP